jgi:hypothetical protein
VTVEVPLANGRGVALVDAEDAERVLRHRWCLHPQGYAQARIGGKLVLMHRFVMDAGPFIGLDVEHEDRDKLNNRRGNLRMATRSQNNQNRSAEGRGSSSHRGVSFCRQTRRWRATHRLDGRYVHIGRFDTEQEAAAAAAAWRAQHMPFAAA